MRRPLWDFLFLVPAFILAILLMLWLASVAFPAQIGREKITISCQSIFNFAEARA